jgi:hypothetical protein
MFSEQAEALEGVGHLVNARQNAVPITSGVYHRIQKLRLLFQCQPVENCSVSA